MLSTLSPVRHAVHSIGEKERAVHVCGNEHWDAVHLGHCSKSTVAEHVHSYKVPHEVDCNSVKGVEKIKKCVELKV